LGHGDAGRGHHADQFQGFHRRAGGQGCARNRDQGVDRHAFRVGRLGRQHLDQRGTVAVAFAHADDAATAQLDAGGTNHPQRRQPVLVGPGPDDARVELGAGVEIVVIGGKTGLGQPPGLIGPEHAQGDAGLHADGGDAAHHFQHGVELGAVPNLAPGRAHTKARSPRRLGLGGGGNHRGRFHDPVPGQPDLGMVGRLRAVGAILGTTAGLDAEQAGPLDVAGVVIQAMDPSGVVDQIEQRCLVDLHQLVHTPVIAHRRQRRPRFHLSHNRMSATGCRMEKHPGP